MIIYTSNVTLIDGSGSRIPYIKITDAKGVVMEMNPRPVDIAVFRPLGEDAAGEVGCNITSESFSNR